MVKRNKRDLMMITLQKATDFYLATLETDGKGPRYIDWLKTRDLLPHLFNDTRTFVP